MSSLVVFNVFDIIVRTNMFVEDKEDAKKVQKLYQMLLVKSEEETDECDEEIMFFSEIQLEMIDAYYLSVYLVPQIR